MAAASDSSNSDMSCSDFKKMFSAANEEFQKMNTDLLGRLSIEHKNSMEGESDPGKALSQVIKAEIDYFKKNDLKKDDLKKDDSNYLKHIRALNNVNKLKIYDINTKTVKDKIDISTIDSTLAISLLRELEGMIPELPITCVPCVKTQARHQCCIQSHHSSYTVDENGKCEHCEIDEALCKLDKSLEMDNKLRNTEKHLTEREITSFLNGSSPLSEFRNVNQLKQEIMESMNGLMNFMRNPEYFPKQGGLSEKDALRPEFLLEQIFKSDEISKKYIQNLEQKIENLTSFKKLTIKCQVDGERYQMLQNQGDVADSWCVIGKVFNDDDIRLDSPFVESLETYVSQILFRELGSDSFNGSIEEIDFAEKSFDADVSTIKFEIIINDIESNKSIPSYYKTKGTKESRLLIKKITENVTNCLKRDLSLATTMKVLGWKPGSIIIIGCIQKESQENWNKKEESQVLHIILHESKKCFESFNVTIEKIPHKIVDNNIIEVSFRVDVSEEKEGDLKNIIPLFKELFTTQQEKQNIQKEAPLNETEEQKNLSRNSDLLKKISSENKATAPIQSDMDKQMDKLEHGMQHLQKDFQNMGATAPIQSDMDKRMDELEHGMEHLQKDFQNTRDMDEFQFQHMLLAANGELQEVTTLLLGRLSIEHRDSIDKTDPGIALSQVLSVNQDAIRNLYPMNEEKIYDITGSTTRTLKHKIDIQTIDTPFAISFLRKTNGMIPQLQRRCNIIPRYHQPCCIKSHHTPYTVDASGACDHCGIDEAVCKLDWAIEMDRKLRNIEKHLTEPEITLFLNGTYFFPDFPNVNLDKLREFMKETMNGLTNFMKQPKYFPNQGGLSDRDALTHEVLLEMILKSTKMDIKKYLVPHLLVLK